MEVMIPISLYLAWVGLNTLFAQFLIKSISHHRYSLPISSYEFSNYAAMIMFIGFPILLFRNRLKKKRIKEYYEYAVERFTEEKTDISLLDNIFFGVDISKEEINDLGRKIKLEEIKRKTKKKFVVRNIFTIFVRK